MAIYAPEEKIFITAPLSKIVFIYIIKKNIIYIYIYENGYLKIPLSDSIRTVQAGTAI